jgi:NAD(P)-dependent dehydrogenase (short-subunit alcohol dehydrogenase family)
MAPDDKKLIAVIGATRQQGGAVVRALQAGGQFKVRALTRNPGKHRELAEEGAAEIAEMFSYFQAHIYLGSDRHGQIALANK